MTDVFFGSAHSTRPRGHGRAAGSRGRPAHRDDPGLVVAAAGDAATEHRGADTGGVETARDLGAFHAPRRGCRTRRRGKTMMKRGVRLGRRARRLNSGIVTSVPVAVLAEDALRILAGPGRERPARAGRPSRTGNGDSGPASRRTGRDRQARSVVFIRGEGLRWDRVGRRAAQGRTPAMRPITTEKARPAAIAQSSVSTAPVGGPVRT
jgi:hypothetical protein